MIGGTFSCAVCGASASPDDAACRFCRATLLTTKCPRCLAALLADARYCPHCGAHTDATPAPDDQAGATALRCPRDGGPLGRARVGTTDVRECARCAGVFLEQASFDRLVADREQQAAVRLSTAAPDPHPLAAEQVRYIPCPMCRKVMNRRAFARGAAVVIDVCREHGVWFDHDELRRCVDFVLGGGLDAARQRDKEELVEERRRLEAAARAAPPTDLGPGPGFDSGSLLDGGRDQGDWHHLLRYVARKLAGR